MHIAAGQPVEIEVKLRLLSADEALSRLQAAGFLRSRERVFEENTLYDTREGNLRQRGITLRLRKAGGICTLTQKGISEVVGGHKVRIENETEIADFSAADLIFKALDFVPSFRYAKRRTEFRKGDQPGLAVLDETPIGDFLELEGQPAWIDETAKALGFSAADYITKSYGALFQEYQAVTGSEQRDMLFEQDL